VATLQHFQVQFFDFYLEIDQFLLLIHWKLTKSLSVGNTYLLDDHDELRIPEHLDQ